MIQWGAPVNYTQSSFREGYMTLSTRLHTLEATSSSMIHRALKQVELRRWRLFGISLKNLLQESRATSCMQFGILSLIT